MNRLKAALAVMLCLGMLICMAGCGTDEPPTTEHTEPSIATDPIASEPPLDPVLAYNLAAKKTAALSGMVVTYQYTQSREVGGETYNENRIGSATYVNFGKENMQALIQEQLTYGTYTTEHRETFLDGSAYTQLNNYDFVCAMESEEFLALQIPVAIFTDELYDTVTSEESKDGIIIHFAQPQGLESWFCSDTAVTLICADGSATLDSNGYLTAATYEAEYVLGYITYSVRLELSVEIATPTLENLQPENVENCADISDLRIVRYMLQTVGDVYTSENISAYHSDTLYSELFAVVRNQSGHYYSYGSGSSFMSSLSSQVTVTDYVGHVEANTQTNAYINGIYTNTVNGVTSTDSSITAEQMRAKCEDAILSSLFSPGCIASAQLTDAGDFLWIEFIGTEDFAETLCNSIYSLLQVDVDNWADSYVTDSISGYLTINRYTGLPTAMGLELCRTHTKDQVAYRLTYQLDQSLELSSDEAYEGITGTSAEISTEASATPLLYKVSGADGQTLWLLGTIHVGDDRTANLPLELMNAFTEADALVVEVDPLSFEMALAQDAQLQAQVANAYYYTSGSLHDYLSEALYGRLQPLMLASGGNSIDSDYLRAIIWQSQIQNFFLQQGYNLRADAGMDQRLLEWARAQEKSIYEIESGLAQLQVLANFSVQLQEMLLEQMLDQGMLDYLAEVDMLYQLWCQGDETALTQLLAQESNGMTEEELKLYEEYYKAMYTNRNAAMLKAATSYLESGETVFYAVGLAHLLGEGALVESLRTAGYTVEIVSYE